MKPMPPVTGHALHRPDLDINWWVQELCDAVQEMDNDGIDGTTHRWRTATTAVLQLGGGKVHWWATIKSKIPEAV